MKIASITDYSEILRIYGLEPTTAGLYWQVGKIEKVQGWILHLSVVATQLQELLELVVPELATWGVPFKIIMNRGLALEHINGSLGYIQVGKMVSIYPETNETANALAKHLINLTNGFRSPAIPTDRHLGGAVYTRYGSFKPVEVNIGIGAPIKCIYNAAGDLVEDPYTIPFSPPEGIIWPFSELATPVLPKKPKLLNGKYFPVSVLKPDIKGSVIRALYFRKPWQISRCIIKEGYQHMYADEAGRDIRDRLQWQHDLYQDLKDEIPLPRVLDYFTNDGTAYLVMEFVQGIHLTSRIEKTFLDGSWCSLSAEEKLKLLNILLKIIEIIGRLHNRNYIHRDITPDNFLINKKGEIFPVDLELAWSGKEHRPDPPFKLGTPGHISPEQWSLQTPTIKEDIYGLGGLMIMIFTNLHAIKFEQYPPEAVRNIIHFFTGEKLLGDLVASCLQHFPDDRPTLKAIRHTLQNYQNKQSSDALTLDTCLPNAVIMKNPEVLVQMGISGLAYPDLLNPNQRWVSLVQKDDARIGNDQKELTLSEGWHTGMTGVLWLVARARNMGFEIEACLQPYSKTFEYLLDHFFPQVENKAPGLYFGAAGVAMAIIEGVKADLLTMDESLQAQLRACFAHRSTRLRLADGLSGQGIALLKAFGYMEDQFLKDTLRGYIAEILANQLSDGSWHTSNKNIKHNADTFTGVDYGIAGIIWFLLCYFRQYPDNAVENAARKALNWLSTLYHKKNGLAGWPVSTGSKAQDPWQYAIGTPGIAHTFIHAYRIWKDPLYKNLAEGALSSLPATPSRMDWSLASGLSGIGEVYLDAVEMFKNDEWQRRSDWIASLFLSCSRSLESSMITWQPGYNTTATADLFTGNGGIIHFLMRHLRPNISSHLLSA